MSDFRRQLRQAVEAMRIHGPTEYSWFGKQSGPAPLGLRRLLSPETARAYLLNGLQEHLYWNFYTRGFAHSEPLLVDCGFDSVGDAKFTAQLSEANCGHGFWETGWTALTIQGSSIAVFKAGLTLCVPKDHVQLCGDPRLVSGAKISILMPKEFLGISLGYYAASGDMPFEEHDHENLLRFYWNLRPEGAPALLAVATRTLNRAGVPFTLKVINKRSRFCRCDAGVLYLPNRFHAVAASIVANSYNSIRVHLKSLIPAFTKELAPGLGFAEDPPGNESFGLHRCRLLAHGIIESREQGKKSINTICKFVEESFAVEGIDLDFPYLNPGSEDTYSGRYPFRFGLSPALNDRPICPNDFLKTAAEIGHHIQSESIWHNGRCNWLGNPISRVAGHPALAVQGMLDSSFYCGTSGVALFLAELHHQTGDIGTRNTALAAMEQALDFTETDVYSGAIGLYTGWPGIAIAAARAGLTLKADCLIYRAKLLIDRCKDADHDGEFDLLSGSAGAIVALIILSALVGDLSLLNRAEAIGRSLVYSAERTKAGSSWESPAFPHMRNLTGFAHGTAGVALALLELFAITGDREFRQCAEEAFRYEQRWFDLKTQNWSDLRGTVEGRIPQLNHRNHPTSWCHGAPGIALSRLRAYEITKSPSAREEAAVAANTTLLWIEECLAYGNGNFSLCHGLAGNAEVLREQCRVLGTQAAFEDKAAERVGEHGIVTYQRTQEGWPCGAVRSNPSMMMGLAGIGYFYLSIGQESPPSVLLLRREEWLKAPPLGAS
jgi:hypothetical protein